MLQVHRQISKSQGWLQISTCIILDSYIVIKKIQGILPQDTRSNQETAHHRKRPHMFHTWDRVYFS